MTVLAAIQAACPALGIAVPTAVFSSTEREHIELAALANDVADRIASHDWQRMKRLQTWTGNGTSESYQMPADFSRFPAKSELRTATWNGPVCYVADHDEWLEMQVRKFTPAHLSYTLLGGRIHFFPILASGQTVKCYYISNLWARSAPSVSIEGFPYTLPFNLGDSVENGMKQTEFRADTDSFELDERLLRLGIVWQWKANKGLPYAEDMQNYEILFAQCYARDKGPRTIGAKGGAGVGASIAYPWTLGQ